MKNTILGILIILIFLPLTIFATDSKGDITVKINNCRNDKGDVIVTLFKSGDGFPEEPEKAYKKLTGKIKDGKSDVVFSDITYGEFAMSILHDENLNGKMDINSIGIPSEGHGASNNPESFGPPEYKDAKFMLNSKEAIIDIKMNYLEE